MGKIHPAFLRVFVWLLLGIELLAALPVCILAVFSLDKIITPTDMGHFALETSLLVSVITILWLPVAFLTRRPQLLRWSILAAAFFLVLAIALLFSPIYHGFIH
jgi:hypothetical protein